MQLQYYQYFINEISQGQLFPEEEGKTSIVRGLLQQKHTFKVSAQELGFVPLRVEDNFIYAKLGKRARVIRHLPPEDDFQEQVDEDWPGVRVFIDTSANPDGQKFAVEYKTDVFRKPLNQLRGLTDAVNVVLEHRGFTLSVNPVLKDEEFWEVVDRHQGNIEEVSFSYLPPNLFGLNNTLSEELKTAQAKYNITGAQVTLKSKTAQLKLPHDDNFVTESVDYLSRGAGEYRIKVRGKRNITSGKNVTMKTVTEYDEIDLSTTDSGTFEKVVRQIFND